MSPVRFLVTPRKESLIVTTKLSAIFLFAWRRGICGKILDLTICNPWPRQPKAHKKPDFVLGSGKNQGKIAHSDTQKPFLCSERPKTGVPKAKKAQKTRFCAREEGDWHREEGQLASGSASVAFLQITAHTSEMQIPHNQTINFWSRAR